MHSFLCKKGSLKKYSPDAEDAETNNFSIAVERAAMEKYSAAYAA
jgi:hypothetical protein